MKQEALGKYNPDKKELNRAMRRFTILISYDTVEIYQQYGSIIEQMTKDKFAEKGATEQTLFISMRSMPPIHTTSFVAPENVTVDDLKEVQFPEGVHVDIHQEA